MPVIINTLQHTNTGLIVEPLGDTGAWHFVPIRGENPGDPFILDAASVQTLRALLADEPDDDGPDEHEWAERGLRGG